MRGGRSISKYVRCGSSSKGPNGIYPPPGIHDPTSQVYRGRIRIRDCFHGGVGVTGPRIGVSVYVLRRHERRGVWLFVGVTTGMEVVVLGGHVIVGVRNIGQAPPWLATWSRIEMVAGGHAHVCM